MLSMQKSKFLKKRCRRLYLESVQALPGIATAILAKFTVRIFSKATKKQDRRSAPDLFQLIWALKIWVSKDESDKHLRIDFLTLYGAFEIRLAFSIL